MDARLRNAVKKLESWPKVKIEVMSALIKAKSAQRQLNAEIEELELWTAFHELDHKTEYGRFRLYEIEDGETHSVAAESKEEALELYTDLIGEYDEDDAVVTELPPEQAMAVRNVEEGGWTGIKTHAEWADVAESEIVSTTAY